MLARAELIPVADGERRRIGPFDVEFIPVTHSVPNGFATAFHTPQGVVLHSGDFKLDLAPVDGRLTDLSRIGAIASEHGIRLLLSDSTNAEEPGYTASESAVGAALRSLFEEHRDKRIITACFASHMHRVQQVCDAALRSGRTVATLGRSMAKNVALARQLGTPASSRRQAHRHRAPGRGRPGEDLRGVDRLAGRADVGTVADGGGGEQVVAGRGGRPRDHQRQRHSGQRVGGGQGDRRPVPVGCRGGPLRPGRGPRQRSRQAGGAADHAGRGQAGSLHPRARRVPSPRPPRPAGRGDGCRRVEGAAVRGRRRRHPRRHRHRPGRARCRPATCTSTAPWATSATASCGTGGRCPRRA